MERSTRTRVAERVLLDTNVLLGATDEASAEHARAVSALDEWPAVGTTLYTSGQILCEYFAVATYDPASDQWRPLAPPPLLFGWAVWTGTEVLAIEAGPGHVIRYTPCTDEWKTLDAIPHAMHLRAVAWTGTELLLWADWSAEVALYTPPA